VYFGRKFYIPADYDILISFAPVGNSADSTFTTSTSGKIRLRTMLEKDVAVHRVADPNLVVFERPPEPIVEPEPDAKPEDD